MRLKLALILTLVLAGSPALATEEIDAMTLNQYLGADLGPVVTAPPAEFNAALVAALQEIAANDFPARADAQAAIIAARLPDAVGLQEAFVFTCTDVLALPPGFGCSDPSIAGAFNDQLAELLDSIADLGESYAAVATVNNLDTSSIVVAPFPPGLPFFINGVPAVLNALDRDVIIVREDHVAHSVPVAFPCAKPSADGCNYDIVAPADTPVGVIAIERGFVGVDLTIDYETFRIVDTHLEVMEPAPGVPESQFFQVAQAAQLIGTLGVTTPPDRTLVVLGDINSSEDDPVVGPLVPPYTQFVAAGYTDAWNLRPGNSPGGTCCQASDLSNQQSEHGERIDVIFSWDVPSEVKKARVLGSKVSEKTPPPGLGLWPSDHGFFAGVLNFGP